MVRCKKCGYDNNDGSRICLNCRENLDNVERSISESEIYIQTNQATIKEADERVKKASKTTLIVILSLVAVFILGVVIYFANLYKPVVDEKLVGTWQCSGYGYVEEWIFEKDGTCSIKRSGTGIFSEGMKSEGYYRAENGKLKISYSGNFDGDLSTNHRYQFGVSKNGTPCLILEQIQSDGRRNTQILYKVK